MFNADQFGLKGVVLMDEIEKLKERISALEEKFTVFEDVMSLLDSVTISNEFQQYINNKRREMNSIDLKKNIPVGNNVPAKKIETEIKNAEKEKAAVDLQIEFAMSQTPAADDFDVENVAPEVETPLERFKYRVLNNKEIQIRKYVSEDDDWDDEDDDEYSDIVNVPASIDGLPVTSIGNNAFEDCELIKIFLPNTITKIGKEAFRDCSNLTEITIPPKVKSIPDSCFYDCKSLEEVNLHEGIESIASQAFENTSIRKIVIPSSVVYMQSYSTFSSSRPMHVLFKGGQIRFFDLDGWGNPVFNSPTTIYYEDKSILNELKKLVKASEEHYCTINHNVQDFYKI